MKEAYNYLFNDIGIKYGDFVVVGVSGGPDSMVLLHLLLKLKQALSIGIVCCHVNHNTGRTGQTEDEKFVRNYCLKSDVIYEVMTVENYGDDNFHNEARSIRYRFFSDMAKKHNAKYIFTAHHADDLIETILMRIVRGSTLRGYSGFSKEIKNNNYIIRPLINVTKEEIIDYIKKHRLKYVVDDSNFEDVYTRNRFRKYVIPALKKEDKLVHKKFAKFSQTLLEYNEYIDKQVRKVIKVVVTQNVLNIEEFLKQEHLIQMKIIYLMLEKYYQDDLMLISDKHAEIIYNLIKSKKANSEIHLPNNIVALKSYNTLTFVPFNISNNEYEIEVIDYLNLPNGKNIERINESKNDDNNICRLNSEEIMLPLHVRNKKDGDKMTVKGMLGSKKISDIFIENKINLKERDLWPIVCDSKNNIVWLPGLKKSKFNRQKGEKYDIILRYY